LFGPKGQLLEDYVTFNGKHRIIVRGTKHVSARICDVCGRQFYFSMGRQYLCPQPTEGVTMFHKGSSGLVVTEEIFARVNVKQWRGLACVRLPVLSAPQDGLGELASPWSDMSFPAQDGAPTVALGAPMCPLNQAGQPVYITDALGTSHLAYDFGSRPLGVSWWDGPLYVLRTFLTS
jgi:hypothetical protein